jgi:hypothetical protein
MNNKEIENICLKICLVFMAVGALLVIIRVFLNNNFIGYIGLGFIGVGLFTAAIATIHYLFGRGIL